MPTAARKKALKLVGGLQKKRSAGKEVALQQLGTFDFDRYQIQVSEDPKSKDKRFMSPLDLAQEAEELQRSQVRHDRRVNDFAAHMFKLAATCSNPEEFRDVCQQIRDETGWGRRHPAPRVWIVYQSAIYQFWKKHKVRPLSEIEAPVVDENRLQYKPSGEVLKQRVRVTGMYQMKSVDRALQMVKKKPLEAAAATGTAELVDHIQAAKSSPELVDAMQRVVWTYAHLDHDSQKALCSRVVRLLKEFPTAEAYPER